MPVAVLDSGSAPPPPPPPDITQQPMFLRDRMTRHPTPFGRRLPRKLVCILVILLALAAIC